MDESQVISVSFDIYTVAAFLGYLIILVGIGLYASRFSSQGISEYFIGGRKMNRFVVALSAVVSGRSAWLLLGVTGMAYAGTFVTMIWYYIPVLKNSMYELVPGFFSALLATWLVSLFARVPEDTGKAFGDMIKN